MARLDPARLARGSTALPGCQNPMRVLAVIDDPRVVEKILRHLGAWHAPPNTSEPHTDPFSARRPQTFQFNGDRSSPCRTSDVFLLSLHSSKFHKYTWAATTNF